MLPLLNLTKKILVADCGIDFCFAIIKTPFELLFKGYANNFKDCIPFGFPFFRGSLRNSVRGFKVFLFVPAYFCDNVIVSVYRTNFKSIDPAMIERRERFLKSLANGSAAI